MRKGGDGCRTHPTKETVSYTRCKWYRLIVYEEDRPEITSAVPFGASVGIRQAGEDRPSP